MIEALDNPGLMKHMGAIGAMVDVENSRGDNIDPKALIADLVANRQFAVLVTGADAPNTPIVVLICQDVVDRIRPSRILYINNIWVPDREEFARYTLTSADLKEFMAVTERYDRVLFQTDNWVLIKMLRAKGLPLDIIANVCEIRRTQSAAAVEVEDANGRIDTV